MKPLDQMTASDVVAELGPPAKITRGTGMTALEWKCSTCVEHITSPQPIHIPAPCPRCGGIAFENVR